MELGLRNASVLVTGGSRGIGLAIAHAFAAEGANIAICGRDATALAAAATQLRAHGGQVLAVQADLLHPDACTDLVAQTVQAFGGLRVLVNNASASVDTTPASLESATDAQLAARFTGKVMPAMRCTRAAIPALRASGAGRILCIGGSSARAIFRTGELPGAGSGLPQGLGNAALANFARHLAEELAPDRITVNTIHPHLTRTDRHADRVTRLAASRNVSPATIEAEIAAQVPLGRVVEPADIAPLVLLLASPLAAAITGQSIAIDGGALRSINY